MQHPLDVGAVVVDPALPGTLGVVVAVHDYRWREVEWACGAQSAEPVEALREATERERLHGVKA